MCVRLSVCPSVRSISYWLEDCSTCDWTEGRKGDDFSLSLLNTNEEVMSPKRESYRERYGKILTQPAKVRMQTQTGSELPGLLICTKPHSNNSQNTHTHNALIFQQKWFTHTRISTSDHRIQIFVPYIGLNNPGTISCLICNAHYHESNSDFMCGLWSQIPLCSLSHLSR